MEFKWVKRPSGIYQVENKLFKARIFFVPMEEKPFTLISEVYYTNTFKRQLESTNIDQAIKESNKILTKHYKEKINKLNKKERKKALRPIKPEWERE